MEELGLSVIIICERFLKITKRCLLKVFYDGKRKEFKMERDETLMDKVKDGFEKTGEKMKEGFDKTKDFAQDAAHNIKEKVKEGWDKLSDMKDDAEDKVEGTGESLNEQLCDSLEGTDDDRKMHIEEEFCSRDYKDDADNEYFVEKEEYEEIMTDNRKEDAA